MLSFPTNLIAGPFGFTPQPFFEIQDTVQREAPAVKFHVNLPSILQA
jgi:LemA protein